MLKILADQCVYGNTIKALRKEGYNVIWTREIGLKNAPDEKIFNFAISQKRILLSFDREFGNFYKFNIAKSFGVVIILVKNRTIRGVTFDTISFFKKLQGRSFRSTLFIVRQNLVRIRKF